MSSVTWIEKDSSKKKGTLLNEEKKGNSNGQVMKHECRHDDAINHTSYFLLINCPSFLEQTFG